MIEAGKVPHLFVEGGYNEPLDSIADLDIRADDTVWMFDRTAMK
jgi:hypothetical protein